MLAPRAGVGDGWCICHLTHCPSRKGALQLGFTVLTSGLPVKEADSNPYWGGTQIGPF